MTVAGLLLAAGAGTRLGRPKALVELDGELLVERGVRLLVAGGCDPVVVVLGAEADRVLSQAELSDVVVAPDWETGMGASLRAGLAALEDRAVDACVVALADQPRIGAQAVARLLSAHHAGAVAAVATYGGAPRNPVLLGRSTWPSVAAASVGDTGARPWLRAHPELVVAVPCDDTGSPVDVDTPEDLHSLEAPP
jgi:CTP:molybdopterin cytidylyltransferase MocA